MNTAHSFAEICSGLAQVERPLWRSHGNVEKWRSLLVQMDGRTVLPTPSATFPRDESLGSPGLISRYTPLVKLTNRPMMYQGECEIGRWAIAGIEAVATTITSSRYADKTAA